MTDKQQKIIMHEGEKKFAIRGTTLPWKGTENGMGPHSGEYKYDPAFKNGNLLFLQYGDQFWKTYLYQDIQR